LFRYANLLQREIELRERSEAKERSIFHEVDQLKTRNMKLETENTRFDQQYKLLLANTEREKTFLQSSYESRFQALTTEKNEIANKAQHELVARMKEISEEYHQRIQELEVRQST
jgi:galactokinase